MADHPIGRAGTARSGRAALEAGRSTFTMFWLTRNTLWSGEDGEAFRTLLGVPMLEGTRSASFMLYRKEVSRSPRSKSSWSRPSPTRR